MYLDRGKTKSFAHRKPHLFSFLLSPKTERAPFASIGFPSKSIDSRLFNFWIISPICIAVFAFSWLEISFDYEMTLTVSLPVLNCQVLESFKFFNSRPKTVRNQASIQLIFNCYRFESEPLPIQCTYHTIKNIAVTE